MDWHKLSREIADKSYDVQARTGMLSPKFYEDLKRLKSKGLPNTEIGRRLGISDKTVKIRLERIL